jgi:hypothetical protein
MSTDTYWREVSIYDPSIEELRMLKLHVLILQQIISQRENGRAAEIDIALINTLSKLEEIFNPLDFAWDDPQRKIDIRGWPEDLNKLLNQAWQIHNELLRKLKLTAICEIDLIETQVKSYKTHEQFTIKYRSPKWGNVIKDIFAFAKKLGSIGIKLGEIIDTFDEEKRGILKPASKPGNDERDEWIYNQCNKGVPYSTIKHRLKSEHPKWEQLDSPSGILQAAIRYAKRHRLPKPPKRR